MSMSIRLPIIERHLSTLSVRMDAMSSCGSCWTLDHNANIDHATNFGRTPLYSSASENGHEAAAVHLLLENNAQVNQASSADDNYWSSKSHGCEN